MSGRSIPIILAILLIFIGILALYFAVKNHKDQKNLPINRKLTIEFFDVLKGILPSFAGGESVYFLAALGAFAIIGGIKMLLQGIANP